MVNKSLIRPAISWGGGSFGGVARIPRTFLTFFRLRGLPGMLPQNMTTHGCFDRYRLGYVGATGSAHGPLGNDVAWMVS